MSLTLFRKAYGVLTGNPLEAIFSSTRTEPASKTLGPAPIINISDAVQGNVEGLIVNIEPVQSGSGNPSPNNVRLITGWTGTNISVNSNIATIAFPAEAGTVYGGTLDVTTGELTVNMAIVDLGTLDWRKSNQDTDKFYSTNASTPEYSRTPKMLCSHYQFDGIATSSRQYYGDDGTVRYLYSSARSRGIYIADSSKDGLTANEFKDAIYGVKFVYELENPLTYNLTPNDIALVRGDNTIFADTGDVTITYKYDANIKRLAFAQKNGITLKTLRR